MGARLHSSLRLVMHSFDVGRIEWRRVHRTRTADIALKVYNLRIDIVLLICRVGDGGVGDVRLMATTKELLVHNATEKRHGSEVVPEAGKNEVLSA
jgi:hypothetical protein